MKTMKAPAFIAAAALAVAAPLASAQITHEVTVAAGKQQVYQPNSLQIAVGDTVKFTWAGGPHTVTQMGNNGDACSPLVGGVDSGKLNVTGTFALRFNTPGGRLFGCTVGQHCANGMKMNIDVLQAGASPSAPPPTQTGAPAPGASDTPVVIKVGANGLTFEPKEVNVAPGTWVKWEFAAATHNVKQVADPNSCDPMAGGFASANLNAGASFMQQFTQPGPNYYVCTFNQHCSKGMKGTVNVQGAGGTPTQGGNNPTGSTSGAATTHTITVGQGGQKFTPETLSIAKGDTVMWMWAGGPHNVKQTADKDSCTPMDGGFQSTNLQTGGMFSRTFGANETTDRIWYVCTVGNHCQNGMKGLITLDGTPGGGAPATQASAAQPGSRARLAFGGVAAGVAAAAFVL
ncbi:uncharacterized protein SPPG_06209 [Spizellomyces punctatus DAOM BR117]|uniref:Phytocyanin domain-containing protein n=1 Tax=Spizellomyces punctatus (strain DAOM BR117) TaxID=645134 RepID=A0A0L0HCP2_SPIPD|nr:uncharacterized protein SPPG_06209 [Spizellomyces punctatus DAOM BR117]KNC98513.1 hypothetical protein SPPG_06209 [Spizellomyces punctatus DAOM BR117]|eukprot:XP_016606553.1 hypothetical protein SPPG_06209 [Spizellomyces punctatus DAOM BR117]